MNETDNSIISMNASTNKAYDFIRYLMVLLDFAEASCMAAGSTTAASFNAINLVRKRAGLIDLAAGLSKETFRDAVV